MCIFGAELAKDQLNKVAETIVGDSQVYDRYSAKPVLRQLMEARVDELSAKNANALRKIRIIT